MLLRGLRSAIVLCIGVGAIASQTTNISAYGAAPQPSQEQPQSHAAAQKSISVWVTVLDKRGQPVNDLTQAEFRVLEDGKEQAITSFAFGVRKPLAVGFLTQWSGRRQSTLPYAEIDPAIQFFQSLMGKNDFSFAAKFADTVYTLIDFTNDPTEIERALRFAESAKPWGPSALYDSIIWACNERLSTRPQRRVLLLVADGHDNQSNKSLRDATESALLSQTTIYVVSLAHVAFAREWAVGQPSQNLGLKRCVHVLKELAEQTGGDAIFARKQEDLAPAFGKIARELHNQYRVGYSPANQARRGEFRKIKIEVKRKGVRVLARKGYSVSRN